jgi:RHS repeat-associated protein
MTVKKLDGIVVASYTYYPNGLRKTKIVGTTIENYYYNGDKLVRVTDGSGTTKWKITWGNGVPMILSTGSGATYYYVTNYRGDVVQIVDSNGAKVADYSYDPWGNVLSTNEHLSLVGQPLGYASYVFDRETLMYYLQAWYYKPSNGVFLSLDPIAGSIVDLISQNGYSYTSNNPITMVDPHGTYAAAPDMGTSYLTYKKKKYYLYQQSTKKYTSNQKWVDGSAKFIGDEVGALIPTSIGKRIYKYIIGTKLPPNLPVGTIITYRIYVEAGKTMKNTRYLLQTWSYYFGNKRIAKTKYDLVDMYYHVY